MKGIFTTTTGNTIEITKDEIQCYRGIGVEEDNCMIYLKDGSQIELKESFNEVDKIFDL